MPKGQITRQDLLTDDAARFGEKIAEQAGISQKAIEDFKKTAQDLNKLALNIGNASDEKALNETRKQRLDIEKKIIANQKLKAQADKEILALETKKEAAIKRGNKLSIEERVLQTELNKIKRVQVRETLGVTGAYQKLNRERTLAQKNLQNLLAADKQNVSQIKLVRAEYDRLNARVLAVDRATNNYTKNVGNYGSALNNVRGIVTNLGSALGVAGGAFAAVSVFRNAINDIREFDLSIQTLSGILRTSRADVKGLEEEIINVGSTTVRTSTQTAQLAETLATLGKSKDQIQSLLLPVTNLSVGLQASSEDAGEFLVQSLNAFGASSDEAERYADIIATIRTSTSLDFQKIKDSFQFLAPISRSLGKDIADTGALIGILADNGIKAERAGRLLGTAQQKLAGEGKTLSDALEELNGFIASGANEIDSLALASDLFGKQASGIGIVLANNTEAIDANAESIRNNSGALNDLVNSQLDSLDGALKLLNSAWEGYVLGVNDANDISGTFKDGIKFLADNLKDILDGLVFLTKAFVFYKASIIGANIVSSIYNKSASLMAARSAAAAQGVSLTTTSLNRFNAALRANAIGVAVAAIGGLILLHQRLSKSVIESSKELNDNSEEFVKNSKEQINSQKNIDRLTDRYKELTKDGVKPNAKEQQELTDIVRVLSGEFPNAVESVDKFTGALVLNTDQIEKMQNGLEGLTLQGAKTNIEELTVSLNKLEEEQSKVNSFLDGSGQIGLDSGVFEEVDGVIKRVTATTDEYTGTTRVYTDANADQVKSIREYVAGLNDSVGKTIEQIKANEDLISSITGDLNARQIRAEVSKLEAEADKNAEERRKKAVIDTQKDEEAAEERRKSIFELTKLRLEEVIRLRKEQADNQENESNIRLNALTKQEEAEIKLARLIRDNERLNADNNIEKTIANEKFASEKIQIEQATSEAVDKIGDEEVKKAIDNQKRILNERLKSIGLIENFNSTDENNAIADINNDTSIQDAEDRERKISEIKIKYAKQALEEQVSALETLLDSEISVGDKRASLELELSELKRNLSELNIEQSDRESEKAIEAQKETLEAVREIGTAIVDFTNSVFDSRISKIDDEISRNEAFYDQRISLAQDDDRLQKALELEKEARVTQLEARRREEQRRQAVFNKVVAVADIGVNTAVNISEVAPNPLLIALAAAIGAAQIATVIATPIPQYELGTNYHPGGLAEVGEKRPEVIKEPGKRPYIANKRQILDLPKGTEVIPSLEEYRKLQYSSVIRGLKPKESNSLNIKNDFDDSNIVKELSLTRKQLSRQKRPVNNIIIKSDHKFKKTGFNGK